MDIHTFFSIIPTTKYIACCRILKMPCIKLKKSPSIPGLVRNFILRDTVVY